MVIGGSPATSRSDARKYPRKTLDDFADTMTLAVHVLEMNSVIKPGSPEYRDAMTNLRAMAKLPEVKDVPHLPLRETTLRHYEQSRNTSVDFYQTAMDGQLKLYWFDHSDDFAAIVNKAAREAARAR
jgi:hypothetical protein